MDVDLVVAPGATRVLSTNSFTGHAGCGNLGRGILRA